MLKTLRVRSRDDAGYNLVELLVAMTIFSVLIASITALMIAMMAQSKDNFARTRSVEQARIGLSQIDRQVRSGNLILDPALDGVAQSGVPANYSLRVYTQEGGVEKCVQWRVIFPATTATIGDLQYRTWAPGAPSTVTDWSLVADNVMRPASPFNAANSSTWPPFWVDTSITTGTEAQNIRITLRMKDPDAKADSKPIAVSSVVTGRNTVFGYSSINCSAVPAP